MQEFAGYFTASELKRRGWSETMVIALLGTPCRTVRNPHCHYGPSMRLYADEKALIAEMREDFIAAKARAEEASRRGLAAADTKRREAFRQALSIRVQVPLQAPDALKANALSICNNDHSQHRLIDDDEALLTIASVEYLLQQCETALWDLDELFGRVGARHAREVLRRRILSEIAAIYPALKSECDRRLLEPLWHP